MVTDGIRETNVVAMVAVKAVAGRLWSCVSLLKKTSRSIQTIT